MNMDSGAVDSAAVGVDSVAEVVMPTPEQLGISIASGPEGGLPAVTVGDTFEFPVTVSWSVQGSALLVVPTGSAILRRPEARNTMPMSPAPKRLKGIRFI